MIDFGCSVSQAPTQKTGLVCPLCKKAYGAIATRQLLGAGDAMRQPALSHSPTSRGLLTKFYHQRWRLEMPNRARFSTLAATLATILICATPVKADPIISVTAPPGLSFGIGTIGAVWSTAWSQSNDYTGVSIAV